MTDLTLPWEQPGWLGEARSWISARLADAGETLTGELEQFHVRPWSTVVRVPASGGLCYFKGSAPLFAHEPALTGYLARLRPDITAELLGVEPQRGWLLMRDSGTPLRTLVKAERSLARWREILPLFVGLQKQLAPRVDDLLALRVPDRRLENLPEKFERLVADEPAMLVGQEDSLTAGEYRRLLAAGEAFTQMCTELGASGIPASLHHDDFHDANLFVRDGQVRFTDWGESAVAHPFFSLVVLLRGAENSLELEPDAPELDEVRGWYLEQWADFAPLAELRRVSALAERVGLVNRALTWQWVIASLPEPLKAEYASAVPAYLQEFINKI